VSEELSGKFQMINVAHKPETLRLARSEGWIQLSRPAFEALENGTNPKGDVLAMAEVAGLMALKKTAEILPLCHPLAIQHARIRFELLREERRVRVESSVQVVGRTGAEMESLMGLQGALLCIYDLSKAVDPVLEIGGIRLLEKSGGKSGHWFHPESGEGKTRSNKKKTRWEDMSVTVVTLSDRASQGVYEDKSGEVMREMLSEWGVRQIDKHVLPDNPTELEALLRKVAGTGRDLILCTGGTGFAPRDTTPECIARVCERPIPGFGELLRSSGAVYTPLSYLSRSQAGLLGKSIVVSLPGSPSAVKEGMSALKYVLPTGVMVARGQNPHE